MSQKILAAIISTGLALGFAGDAFAKNKKKYVPPTPHSQQKLERIFKKQALALQPHCEQDLKGDVCQTGLRLLDADMNHLPAHYFMFYGTETHKDEKDKSHEVRVYMMQPGKLIPTHATKNINDPKQVPTGPVVVSDKYPQKRWMYTQWADLFQALNLDQGDEQDISSLMVFNYANADNPNHNKTLKPEQLTFIYTTGGDIWDVVTADKKDAKGKSLDAIKDNNQWVKFEKGKKASKFQHLMIPKDFKVRVPNSYILKLYDDGTWEVPQTVVDFVVHTKDKKQEETPPRAPVEKAGLGIGVGLGGGHVWSEDLPGDGAGYALVHVYATHPDIKNHKLGLEFLIGGSNDSYRTTAETAGPNAADPYHLTGWSQHKMQEDAFLLDILARADLKIAKWLYFTGGVGVGMDFLSSSDTEYVQLLFENGDIADEAAPTKENSNSTDLHMAYKLGATFCFWDKNDQCKISLTPAFRGRTDFGSHDEAVEANLEYTF
ncbi:hypothetical protein HOK51_05070 [Candidatus Woesearchaeota archaeon]|nr:hypothetical protein [Candidatus Woesearchaeota archaeon]MBT7367644.1 hypothetical protein [Candidatus Woesearchaeota archaeon]